MLVKEAMTMTVKTVERRTPMSEVARIMRETDVGGVPVLDGAQLIGVVTDRDIAARGVGGDKAPDTPIDAIVSFTAYYCTADADLSEAAAIMAEHQVQRIPVLDWERNLVGMLSLADLAKADKTALTTAASGITEGVAKERA